MGVSRILVVDDEADIVATLKRYLEGNLHVEVVTARSSREALELLHGAGPFDLIVTDYRMAGMTGLEFLRRAKQHWPDVPRVLLTAHPDVHLAIAAINEGGISRFLTKPVEPAQLVTTVCAVTGARPRDERP